jgi:predicted dehydrogenase
LVGFYDPNQENADKISKEFGYKHFSTTHSYTCSGCNRYCNSNSFHYKCAKVAIKSKHFYRKPISNTIEEAEEIITLANEYNVKGQVGHGTI